MPTDPISREVYRQANDWFVRVQLEEGFDRDTFEIWRADPINAAAYDEVVKAVGQTDIAATSELVATSRLRRASVFERHSGAAHALAAGLAVVTLLGTGVWFDRSGYFETPQAVADGSIYATRIGEVRVVTLPDGSKVTLDTDSVLRIAFSSSERRLRLDAGRARFDVAHDAARPFIVTAGGGSVIARGTVFDVRLTPAGVSVVLLEGAIEVRNRRGGGTGTDPDTSSTRRLAAGQQISFVPSDPLPPPQPARPADLRWTSGMLSFDDARLADAVAELNRYSARKITLAAPALGELKLSGGFRAGDVDRFAEAVALTFGLDVVAQPGGGIRLVRNDPELAK